MSLVSDGGSITFDACQYCFAHERINFQTEFQNFTYSFRF